jgi:hypothetical protein
LLSMARTSSMTLTQTVVVGSSSSGRAAACGCEIQNSVACFHRIGERGHPTSSSRIIHSQPTFTLFGGCRRTDDHCHEEDCREKLTKHVDWRLNSRRERRVGYRLAKSCLAIRCCGERNVEEKRQWRKGCWGRWTRLSNQGERNSSRRRLSACRWMDGEEENDDVAAWSRCE